MKCFCTAAVCAEPCRSCWLAVRTVIITCSVSSLQQRGSNKLYVEQGGRCSVCQITAAAVLSAAVTMVTATNSSANTTPMSCTGAAERLPVIFCVEIESLWLVAKVLGQEACAFLSLTRADVCVVVITAGLSRQAEASQMFSVCAAHTLAEL